MKTTRGSSYALSFFLSVLSLMTLTSLALISFPSAAAVHEQKHIALLTVSDFNNTEKGGIAVAYLDMRPGKGSVYLDSFPLTKPDTQISVRVAQQLACDFTGKTDTDCRQYDFFYTFSADASLVSGPSAGASLMVLTVAALDDLQLSSSTIMTGTINSGAVIGPVAGIKAKVDTAVANNYTTILIPKFDIEKYEFDNNSQETTPITAMKPAAKIIRISNIRDALYSFTGKQYPPIEGNISIPAAYSDTMLLIAQQLCDRVVIPTGSQNSTAENADSGAPDLSGSGQAITAKISSKNSTLSLTANPSKKEITPEEQYRRAQEALNAGNAYTAASYCFGAAVKQKESAYGNITIEQRRAKANDLKAILAQQETAVGKIKLNALSDLETFMIVKERLVEAGRLLANENNISGHDLAYAEERLASAIAWERFFGILKDGAAMPAVSSLKQTCIVKINEAEERVNYAFLYYPELIDRKEIDQAREYYADEQYPLCIFSATKAKSDADTILNVLYIDQSQLDSLLQEKLSNAKQVILKEEKNKIFPIIGYSYYEYANSLNKYDPASALIYSEYATELSNLELYFPHESTAVANFENESFSVSKGSLIVLIASVFVSGFVLGMLILLLKRKSKKTGAVKVNSKPGKRSSPKRR